MLMVFCKAVTALIVCALLFVGGVQLEFQRWCSQRQAFRPVGWVECDVHAAGFQGASQDDDDDFHRALGAETHRRIRIHSPFAQVTRETIGGPIQFAIADLLRPRAPPTGRPDAVQRCTPEKVAPAMPNAPALE